MGAGPQYKEPAQTTDLDLISFVPLVVIHELIFARPFWLLTFILTCTTIIIITLLNKVFIIVETEWSPQFYVACIEPAVL